jgi:hypothetical protein
MISTFSFDLVRKASSIPQKGASEGKIRTLENKLILGKT